MGRTYAAGGDPRIAQAVEAAKNSEVALVFAGLPEAFESEGGDRANIDLPGNQNELIRAVAAANPNTVVVLNAGAPVTMPWVDDVAAIVWAILPRVGKRQCRHQRAHRGGQPLRQAALHPAQAPGRQPILHQRHARR